MQTPQNELKKIATLASIRMDEESALQLAKDVSAIMSFVETLKDVNTDNIAPLLHPLDLNQRLREDEVDETNQVIALEKIAPQFCENHYRVPKVIETGK